MESVNGAIGNITVFLTTIILLVLTIATLRDVLVKFGFKPKWKRIAHWFDVNFDKALLGQMLEEFGYTNSQICEIRNKNKTLSNRYNDKNIVHYEESLIALMSNYTYTLSGEKEYGNDTLERSGYYIHTMEMVHNPDNLKILASIMYHLIINDNKEAKNVDFIIVPKGGNPFLAKCVAEMLKADLLVLKGTQEESSLKISVDEDPLTYFKINFEGGNELLKKQRSKVKTKIRGIVVDCNTSGGSQVFNAISTFNKLIEKQAVTAEYINVAYVLFRVDDGKNKFDDRVLNEKEYRLVRYFDLNEDIKMQLFELSADGKILDYTTEVNRKNIDDFLKNNNLKHTMLKNHKKMRGN